MHASPSSSSSDAIKRIAVCADDFGLNADVDAGIIALSEQGRLTATSCLTTGPTWPTSAARLRELPIDAGLHLNFTEAFAGDAPHLPLSLPLPALIRACYLRRLPKSRLAEQIERQCDAFERHYGRAPDFVDGHQHVHQLPMIRDALLPILARRYAGQPLWLRRTAAPAALPAFRFKAFVIAALGSRRFATLAEAQGWRLNGRLLGVYDFSSDADGYAHLLRGWLQAAKDGDLLMCHPAIAGAALTQPHHDAIAAQRPVEFATLADPRVDAWRATAGVRLVRLSELH
ncbi:ChbG/HpnK family deacetylase [Propionivibrio dicarboxylicus]|uniref:Predicted glycoside hydrolase or deacetylase ChbG, UPF0249 family n=1 Tax=Propionivibrio dicarboxylicus TaxID=83767 RepID=A0A1G8DG41_9RHOO|nr:ChbG/HpnK family deacetylase [Propionivibrio dicarboxylicus]SDH56544.1 Predicted glycoside hydrolase or deacetylase ChbG, UPF0249 family [Propionivibrio dicarboxylicus]